MSSPVIHYPLVSKKPAKLIVAPVLLMAMAAVVLLVMVWAALQGSLSGLEGKTLLMAYGMVAVAVAVFLGGLFWLLNIARFKLTFPDCDHLTLRTLKGTTSCAILDINATVLNTNGQMLVFKDAQGKTLGSLESAAPNWTECLWVIKDAHDRATLQAWYQRMMDMVWYCPMLEDSICVKGVEDYEDTVLVFIADEPDLALSLAENPDSVCSFPIGQLVDIVSSKTDDWALMLVEKGGDDRHIVSPRHWREACEMLGL